MRAGGAYHRVKFFTKQVTRDSYGASSDSWDYNTPTITTRGEVRYTGGGKSLNNEEKFYARNIELIVRYQNISNHPCSITETMKIQIDGTNDLWMITYMEALGRNETLRLTIEKCADGLSAVIVAPPTGFTAVLDEEVAIDLNWTNNVGNDGVSIERSKNGNTFTEITRIAKTVSPVPPVVTYKDEDLDEETEYFYRIRAFQYYNYSAYTPVSHATTETIIP